MDLSSATIYVLIFGAFAANFALRFAPLAVMSRLNIPRPVMRWLSYMPVAVMGALVTVEVLIPALNAAFFADVVHADAAMEVPAEHVPLYLNPGIFGALTSAAVFYYTRSFIGATVTGIAVFALISHFI